jgi:hypothetical protein
MTKKQKKEKHKELAQRCIDEAIIKNKSPQEELQEQQFEYNILIQGYHSRDETMPKTFYQMVQTFSIFNILLFGSGYLKFLNQSSYMAMAMYFLIAIVGFISLLAFLLDMEGVSSGKNAIREMCTELEDKMIKQHNRPRYWHAIANRQKYFLENMFKAYNPNGMRELRTGGFGYLKASKIIVLLWGTSVIIYGFELFNLKIIIGQI